jgi:DNA modification methylase
MPTVELRHGDCIEVMATLPDNSIDSIVTDPPYGLEFMGKEWDAPWKGTDAAHVKARELRADEMSVESKRPYIAAAVNKFEAGLPFQQWCTAWATEALRVLKPGGHLLAFGGTRTYHRLAVAIEDAGFEIRDSMMWLYGSGFPKSHDVSKAIDKKRDDRADILRVTSEIARLRDTAALSNRDLDDAFGFASMAGHWTSTKSQPAVPRIEQWAVLRDMLNPDEWLDDEVWRLNGRKGKPGEAWQNAKVISLDTRWNEPSGIVQVGQGERIQVDREIKAPATDSAKQWHGWGTALKPAHEPIVVARKPLIGTVAANVLEWHVGAMNIDGCRINGNVPIVPQPLLRPNGKDSGHALGSGVGRNGQMSSAPNGRWPANVVLSHTIFCDDTCAEGCPVAELDKQAESEVSRFFYVAKANKRERPNVDGVAHPTVKPLALMQWLVRLVTPAGGTVLEPFAGSGTTVEAALLEGCNVLAIEKTEDYLPLINARIERVANAR